MECKNLEFYRKQTKAYEIIFKEDGIGKDITSWSVYFTVKELKEDTDSTSLIDKTVTTHEEPTNGKTLIELESTDTDITAGNYYYEVAYKDDEGNEGVLFSGRLKIIEPLRKTRA